MCVPDVSDIPEELPEGKEATDEDLNEEFEEIEEVISSEGAMSFHV